MNVVSLFGYSVTPTLTIDPGAAIVSSSGFVFAHPLDVIAMRHPDDALGRLRASMDWILARAMARFDRALAALDADQSSSVSRVQAGGDA